MSGRVNVQTLQTELKQFNADELRDLIIRLVQHGDYKTAKWIGEVVERTFKKALENKKRSAPDSAKVKEMLAFADKVVRKGYADGDEVDEYLAFAAEAFAAQEYDICVQFYSKLLPSLSSHEIDMGYYESIEEVIDADLEQCAGEYAVSVYLNSGKKDRAKAVFGALLDIDDAASMFEPLSEMEQVYGGALPELDSFLPDWKKFLEDWSADERDKWFSYDDDWLREVTFRLEGVAGLEKRARKTKSPSDFSAWGDAHVRVKNWKAALNAYRIAAKEVKSASNFDVASFYEQAALAAQELNHKDKLSLLHSAWKTSPSMERLQCWLGAAGSKKRCLGSVNTALMECPKSEKRQQAFLMYLRGEFVDAAKLTGAAPALGWSELAHPGHLMIPLIVRLFENGSAILKSLEKKRDVNAFNSLSDWDEKFDDVPHLYLATVEDIVKLSGVSTSKYSVDEKALLKELKKIASKRAKGILANQRRNHYHHVAWLMTVCLRLDASSSTTHWFNKLKTEYKRYSAFQREFEALA